jgi:hypothetical protein
MIKGTGIPYHLILLLYHNKYTLSMGLFSFLGGIAKGVGSMFSKIPIIGAIPGAVGKLASSGLNFVGKAFGEGGDQTSHKIRAGLQSAQDAYQSVGDVGRAISNIPGIGERAREFGERSGLTRAYGEAGGALQSGQRFYDKAEGYRQEGRQIYNDPMGSMARYGTRMLRGGR